jgi:hypothetical protein
MNLPSRFFAIACAILVIGGCSHGTTSELPTSPTPAAPAVSVRRLTITPAGGGTIIAGKSAEITSSGPFPTTGATLGAFAEYTDGSGKYVEANWTSSDPNVLIVSNGSLRALGRGTATLTASAEGHTASETFIVEPGIAGSWAGTYVVDQCAAGSASMHQLICDATPGRQAGILQPGAVAPISFQITQSGNDLSATAAFGEIRGTLTGIDRGQNFLTLKGDLTVSTTTLTLVYWDARVKTDAMEAFIGFEVRIAGVPSHANVTGRFVDVSRR